MGLREQLCINNMTYRRYSFSYFLKSVKRLGLDWIELSGCHPHYSVYEARTFPVRRVAERIREAGIRVAVIEPEQNFLPVNIASNQSYLRNKSIEQLRFYIENAAAFDCKKVIIYPGKGIMDRPPEEARKYCCESLDLLCRTAEQCGVTLLLQNVSPCISGLTKDSRDIEYILEQTGHDSLALSVNTCAVCAGGETLEDYFRKFGDRILNVQISDSDEEDEQLVLGDGDQDLRAHVDTLKKYRYTGPVALEITMEEYAYEAEKYYARSMDVFERILKGGGQDA